MLVVSIYLLEGEKMLVTRDQKPWTSFLTYPNKHIPNNSKKESLKILVIKKINLKILT
jgi:hypothetical protein